ADPHEIANVCGLTGIDYVLAHNGKIPLDIYVNLSSCVPATHLEHAGASLSAEDLATRFDHPGVCGLAEVMNFPGVFLAVPDVLKKIVAAGERPVDGHCPGLRGKNLNAYLTAGIGSDHECTTAEEAEEKLRRGMAIMIREGTVARNLAALLGIVSVERLPRLMFCTDDREPVDLVEEGHLDFLIRKAAGRGLDPITAIRMCTINVANYFGVSRRGAVAPGYQADLVVVEDLFGVKARMVFKAGRLVARDGEPLWDPVRIDDSRVVGTMNMAPLTDTSFHLEARGTRAHVIELVPRQIVTNHLVEEVKVTDGAVVSDPSRDLLKLAVVERHHATGRIGLGLARGFGLKKGALASTVAHDSHNLVVVGVDDASMRLAAEEVARIGGGLAAAADGNVLASLPLPIAGLMSDRPLVDVKAQLEAMYRAAKDMGGKAPHPYMSLAFLALPVIPSLKITDMGVVDVEKFELIDLFV
ncbi:MAG: adenine deaminase, partial [Candidatus Eremiobacterota bacterium]